MIVIIIKGSVGAGDAHAGFASNDNVAWTVSGGGADMRGTVDRCKFRSHSCFRFRTTTVFYSPLTNSV